MYLTNCCCRKIHENTDFRWHHYNLKKLDKLDWEEYLSNSWGQDAKEGKGLDSVEDPDRGWTLGFIVGEFSLCLITKYLQYTLVTRNTTGS